MNRSDRAFTAKKGIMIRKATRHRNGLLRWGMLLLFGCGIVSTWGILRAETVPEAIQANQANQAQTSEAAKQSAIRLLPLDKLTAEGRAKVRSVISNVTMFRRLPVQVIDCDPDLYLFVVRHPDVIVNTWRALKISQLQLTETGTDKYRMKEVSGTSSELEMLYKSHDTHVLYAEGRYESPLVKKTVKGQAIFILKTGYIREPDNRYYVTCRLDVLLSVDPGAVELITKAIQPVLGKIADNNFYQTVSFVSSLSRTCELNNKGVQRLALQLPNVRPEVRQEFAGLAETVSKKSTAVALRRLVEFKEAEIASRNAEMKRR